MEPQPTMNPVQPVLLVDDEEQALTSMSITLRTAGFNNLRVCSDSRKVSDMLTNEEFSLVILDLNMPFVTGQEIIRRSAAIEGHPPVVVVTASTQIQDYAEGAAGGVVDYLVKPIDRHQLIGAVQRALAHPSSSHEGLLARKYLLADQISRGAHTGKAVEQGVVDMLEHTRREYRRLIGSLPTPYVLLDDQSYRICYCNDAFLGFLGCASLAAAEQVSFFDLLDAGAADKAIRALKENRELPDVELRGRTPGGRAFVIAGSFRLSAQDGFVEGGFVDVTAARNLEQELARAHRLEMVGRLAAGLAHDFNNTLLVVTGFAELIASEEGMTQPVREYANEIIHAVAKATKIIRQLFSMGKAPLPSNACIQLNSMLREAEASLRRHLRPDQSLVLSLAPDDPVVDIAASQLDQVVRNLVLNARDAMPAAGTITIATATGRDPTFPRGPQTVVLEVRDTGSGMDEGTLAKIFEPFFTTKSEREGTGLGLSMVQMIIEASGGRIHAESAPGSGTLFRIVLPSAADEAHGRQGTQPDRNEAIRSPDRSRA